MPKFLVTSGSHFTPLSYEELVKPIAYTQQQHDAAQEAYDTLNLETEAIRQYISDNPDDSQALQIYNNYSNRLATLQDNLWKNGITARTKQDLSAARAGYAEVAKVKNAIASRQARSKEYWDARHKNPSLIMGEDPGLAGLNNYLNDENYGQNWYSYSGQDFMTEVGTDAKARADELLRDAEIQKNKDLVGKLIRIKREGFTSDEVRNAGDAVEAVFNGIATIDSLGNLSGEEQILADVLLSHMNSTGARGNVSPEEFNRLIQYGRSGLSQAIGKTQEQIIDDEVWKNNQEWNMWKRKADYTAAQKAAQPTGGSGKSDASAQYQIFSQARDLTSDESRKTSAFINKMFKDKFGDGIEVVAPDGSSATLMSPFDAQEILDTLGKEKFLSTYGVDPDAPTGTFEVEAGNGKRVKMRVSRGVKNRQNAHDIYDEELKPGEHNILFVEYKDDKGNWVLDPETTRNFNKDLIQYNSDVKDWREKNGNIDIQNLGIKEKDWKEMQEKYHFPDSMPREFYPYAIGTLANVGYKTPAYLMTHDMSADSETWTGDLISTFTDAQKKGKLEKGSSLVLEVLGPDGNPVGTERDYRKALVDEKGNYSDDAIREVYADPEDIIKNRIIFKTLDGKYAVSPRAFGNDVNKAYSDLRKEVVASMNGTTVHDKDGIIDYMMKPLLDPGFMFTMSDDEEEIWKEVVSEELVPFGFSARNVDPKIFIVSPEAQELLRNSVVAYINSYLAAARDRRNNLKYKSVSGSTTKPIEYNNGSFSE